MYRPPPGHVNTTEMDIKKMYKLSAIFGQEQSMVGTEKVELGPLQRQLSALQVCIPFIITFTQLFMTHPALTGTNH